MSSAASHPHYLRLVGRDAGDVPPAMHELERAKLDVIKENRIAAHFGGPSLDPKDPRWILAMQTQSRLMGTALTPERRDQLIASGKRMGLRPFEANLVIAIVQDRARTGLPVDDRLPTLALVGSGRPSAAKPTPDRHVSWPQWLAAIAAAMAVAGLLIRWLAWH